jgi:hypothetical protein
VDDAHAVRPFDDGRQLVIVAARKYVHVMAVGRELARRLRDVDVLAATVDTACRG